MPDQPLSSAPRALACAAIAAALALAGCAAPSDDSGSAESSSAAPSSVTEPSGEADPSLSITPTDPPPSPAEPSPQVSPDDWPPDMPLDFLKDAGATSIGIGQVTWQAPGGFTTTGDGTWVGTDPVTGAQGSITLASAPAASQVATNLLSQLSEVLRNGAVDVPNAVSAAIADASDGDQQTWIVGVVSPDGQLVTAEFSAPVDAWPGLLLAESAFSLVVAA